MTLHWRLYPEVHASSVKVSPLFIYHIYLVDRIRPPLILCFFVLSFVIEPRLTGVLSFFFFNLE